MEIPYKQLQPQEALRVYADWLLEQRVDSPFPFFHCIRSGSTLTAEWYMISYPMRTLMLAANLLNEEKYREAVFPYIDRYVGEQLPNGGFTSNFRSQPTSTLTKQQFHHLLRTGKINLADNGSNVLCLIQAAMSTTGPRRETYLKSARRWLDEWVPLWALPNGGYGNGIWEGHKINSPYTCAMGTVTAALSAYSLVSGEREFVENAERCILYQCDQWLDDGRPINSDCYPLPRRTALNDYSHSFYLLEGMCWTHYVSKNEEVKKRIAQRLKEWFHGKEGILSQWRGNYFNFQFISYPPDWEVVPGLPMSRMGLRPGWELAKSNGILSAFSYYLNHIEQDEKVRDCLAKGVQYLSHPLHARSSGVGSEPQTSYGLFAVQSTGFAGLSLAEAIKPDSVFTFAGSSLLPQASSHT